MNIFRALQRPEYFWRPRQVWRRLRRDAILARNQVRVAWELPFELDPASHVGNDILNHGVSDIVVTEAILRLLDPGEEAIDVGANIGLTVSMMALALGPKGHAIAFEPGPESWRILTTNVAAWAGYDLAPISIVRKGLSDRTGSASMHESIDLGGFSLEDEPPGPVRIRPEGSSGITIELTTLDAFLPGNSGIGLIKIDVEGHELQVLEGAKRLLEQKRIRDIVFEDFHPHPSPVILRLQAAGYNVFSLGTAWRKPLLQPVKERPVRLARPPNFLATLDPERARARFQDAGWKCLRIRARLKPA